MLLMEAIKAAAGSKIDLEEEEWLNDVPKKSDDDGLMLLAISSASSSLAKRHDQLATTYNLLPKIQLFVFGAFYAILENAKSVIRTLKLQECLLPP